jgi:predicted amidohydrolase
VKIGFLQTRPKFGAVKENVRAAKSLLKNITEATVVLPELFNTGYLFRSRDELADLSESATSGYTVGEMKKIAKQKHLNLVFGMAEKKGAKYYNSSVLITAKGKVSVYQKTHLFDREKLFFSPGDRVLRVHFVDEARIGMMVCFDWFFPEVARVLALKGALILCHPSNLVMPWCQEAMRTRSIENKVFSITANRIGTEKRGNMSMTFTGKSQVIGPTGDVLSHAGERSESLNLFADRKVTLYKPIVSKTVR